MKTDRERKQARMGEHLPGFPGYSSLHYGETDRQFRRLLAAEMEKVRDRLAEFVAGMEPKGEKGPASALRETAGLREKFLQQAELSAPPPPDEERLLDLDLALLDRIAALHTPLDRMEAAAPDEFAAALALFRQGLDEVAEMFAKREEILAGNAPSRR